jgi:ParB family chromosome partitioning protein
MATERHLRELKPLEPEQRIEVARSIDFANTSVREVREIVQQAKNPAHVAYNSGNNEWYTPPEYIAAARRVMDGIDCDPASSDIANRIVGASRYFTAENDGLDHNWSGRVWMNPPYAGELIGKFTEKLAEHFTEGSVFEAIVLVNNATETNWFQGLLVHASAVCFPRQRVKFIDMAGNPTGAPLQGQAVLYLGDNPVKFGAEFSAFGTVMYGRCATGCHQE